MSSSIPHTGHSSLDRSKSDAFLGRGSKIVGNLNFNGPVEIAGEVEGEIVAQDRITISESAVINARIVGGEVVIHGTVNGDIQASKRLSLKKPAKVFGNISSNNLSIDEGVVFEGKCSMAVPNGSDAGKSDLGKAAVKPNPTPKLGSSI